MKRIQLISSALALTFACAIHAQNLKLELPKATAGVSAGMLIFPEDEENVGPYREFNPRAGIDLDFHFSKRSTFSTGFYAQSVAYKSEFFWGCFGDPRFPYPMKEDIRLMHLDVPLLYQFRFLRTQRLGFYGSAGVIPSILLHSAGTVHYSDNSQTGPINIANFNLSLFGGVGMVCRLGQNSFIKLEPGVRQYRSGFEGDFDIIYAAQRLSYSLNLSFVSRIDWKCSFRKGAWKPLPRCE